MSPTERTIVEEAKKWVTKLIFVNSCDNIIDESDECVEIVDILEETR